jgi:hypothetical protein
MDMNTTSHRQKDELRAGLFSLVAACPVDECNPEDCPLYLLRQMKPTEQLERFSALDEDDLRYLATYHHICFHTKLALKAGGKI